MLIFGIRGAGLYRLNDPPLTSIKALKANTNQSNHMIMTIIIPSGADCGEMTRTDHCALCFLQWFDNDGWITARTCRLQTAVPQKFSSNTNRGRKLQENGY